MNPPRKRNNGLELLKLELKTVGQRMAADSFAAGSHLLMTGPAGTGKTVLAMNLALREVAANRARRVVIVRSVLPSRDVGYLPGDIEEKGALYEIPYRDACAFLYGRDDAYECLKTSGAVRFMTTSFARGVTIKNAVLVIDEASNMIYRECDTMITRAGDNVRVIVCGDAMQSDLDKQSDKNGFLQFCDVLRAMPSFAHVIMTSDDVLRSELVREYLEARKKVLKQ